jgi:hypothetical protein
LLGLPGFVLLLLLFSLLGSIAESMGGIGEIGGSIGGSGPLHPTGLPAENQDQTFLRRKDKKHSAPSRWSGRAGRFTGKTADKKNS